MIFLLPHEVIFKLDDRNYGDYPVKMASRLVEVIDFLGGGKTSHSALSNDSYSYGLLF